MRMLPALLVPVPVPPAVTSWKVEIPLPALPVVVDPPLPSVSALLVPTRPVQNTTKRRNSLALTNNNITGNMTGNAPNNNNEKDKFFLHETKIPLFVRTHGFLPLIRDSSSPLVPPHHPPTLLTTTTIWAPTQVLTTLQPTSKSPSRTSSSIHYSIRIRISSSSSPPPNPNKNKLPSHFGSVGPRSKSRGVGGGRGNPEGNSRRRGRRRRRKGGTSRSTFFFENFENFGALEIASAQGAVDLVVVEQEVVEGAFKVGTNNLIPANTACCCYYATRLTKSVKGR
ncbi:hypothetical protein K435DRAFT_851641 [Dendrothele bispora CBS 962.96]|uniref:Uncharacterized protein n=1 Tax=Dendrothele bispora (strain CBS 962.96) TaxID=1314807 RepID=A0A4S8MLC3_DENBC|nr:hypothetical protein K435DRAFT_851641 [Dendrothele bispora CBS 962.96]